MTTIDFTASAELFPTRSWKAKAHGIRYKRFDKAADAIRYAIEDLPPECLLGTYLEVDEARFDSRGIRRLYESEDFPRKSASKTKRAKRATKTKRTKAA